MLTATPAAEGCIDFTTAFARLLRDGNLRDEFRSDPAALADAWRLEAPGRFAFLALDGEDLEAQAVVLLRKRFAQVRRQVPRTCEALGAGAWPAFLVYSRTSWPDGTQADLCDLRDARDFCGHLARTNPAALCAVEINRVRFLLSDRRAALHFAPWQPGASSGRAVQLLIRARRNGAWREFLLHA